MDNKKKLRKKWLQEIAKIICFAILVYAEIKFIQFQFCTNINIVRYVNYTIVLLQLIFVLHIIYKFKSPSYKLLWVIFLMFFPIPAFISYIVFGNSSITKKNRNKVNEENINSYKYISKNEEIFNEIKDIDKTKYNQVNYIFNTVHLPVYKNSYIQYLKIGEEYFESLICEIAKAKKYIFLEYFTIVESNMWNRLFDALKQKVSEGVKIYLIVDGMGNSEKLPKDFKENLEKSKINYKTFNSSILTINKYLNYRDHRKIVVIDGEIIYTGGINIGDEYINEYEKFGHWKDSGIKLEGKASLSYVVLFIKMWNLCNENNQLKYENFINNEIKSTNHSDGYIMPYCDGPDNDNNTALNLYIQIINSAKDYIYITTPYLILDMDIVTALVNSAKSGVDVRILMPYIPDKKTVHTISRAFYEILLESGVKIYEYKPGFIHSKVFVSDDELATVGTINLDFRGLYFHYECGNWIYKTGEEIVIRDDFLDTQEKSIEIKLEEWKKRGVINKFLDKLGITCSALI